MALSNNVKEKIAIEVIKTLVTQFGSFPEDAFNNRNAPFYEAFLNAFSDKLNGKVTDTPFFISLSSWLHGLNTTIIADLSTSASQPNLDRENQLLFANYNTATINAMDFSADVFF